MSKSSPQGPWSHRWLVRLLTALFGVLVWWLLGFVLDDISSRRGPDYTDLEKQRLSKALVTSGQQLNDESKSIQRAITTSRARQRLLRESTDTAQKTMEQLLEFQRLNLEQEVTPTAAEQSALAESQQRFLKNQAQYEELTDEIAQLESQQRNNQNRLKDHQSRMAEAKRPIRAEYERLLRQHELLQASAKLGILIPLLVVGVTMFFKRRQSLFVPLVAAFSIAVSIRVLWVMHEHFPEEHFKYILIGTILLVVTAALVKLLNMVAAPKPDWLNKQYREAYEAFLCPVCSFPIRRGPLRFLYWTRRSISKLRVPESVDHSEEEPYSCPSCGTRLFDACQSCGKVRHTLLPTCTHCGDVASLEHNSRTTDVETGIGDA